MCFLLRSFKIHLGRRKRYLFFRRIPLVLFSMATCKWDVICWMALLISVSLFSTFSGHTILLRSSLIPSQLVMSLRKFGLNMVTLFGSLIASGLWSDDPSGRTRILMSVRVSWLMQKSRIASLEGLFGWVLMEDVVWHRVVWPAF